jgi:hypothetical protein
MFRSTEISGMTANTCHIFGSSSCRSSPVQKRSTTPAPIRRLFWWLLVLLSKVVTR